MIRVCVAHEQSHSAQSLRQCFSMLFQQRPEHLRVKWDQVRFDVSSCFCASQVLVIIANALVMGFSTDLSPSNPGWDIAELEPWTLISKRQMLLGSHAGPEH